MNDIGEFALLLALATALYGVVSYVMAFRSNRVDVYMSADKTPIIVWACIMVSSISLWKAFMTNDFSLQYVWAYSNIDLDVFYKFSSFWGGQKGSLLFWTLILTTYMMVVHVQNRKQNVRLAPIALAVMMVITLFFLVLLNFSTNPFERLPLPPEDGRGLNPLLQNYWMVIHPPTLYLGYVGFTVPFAFAAAALLTKNLDDGWIRLTRKWTLVSWVFLCMGNLACKGLDGQVGGMRAGPGQLALTVSTASLWALRGNTVRVRDLALAAPTSADSLIRFPALQRPIP